MGTSADFEAAIAEGATIVRIGTAIFGPRDTTEPLPLIIAHMNINAAFVGGGNMGGALIRGLIARGLAATEHQRR